MSKWKKGFTIYTVVCYKDLQPVRKAVTTHVKNKIQFLRTFDIANQLLIRHTPFASLGQVDSVDGRLSEFSLSVTTKIPIDYGQ